MSRNPAPAGAPKPPVQPPPRAVSTATPPRAIQAASAHRPLPADTPKRAIPAPGAPKPPAPAVAASRPLPTQTPKAPVQAVAPPPRETPKKPVAAAPPPPRPAPAVPSVLAVPEVSLEEAFGAPPAPAAIPEPAPAPAPSATADEEWPEWMKEGDALPAEAAPAPRPTVRPAPPPPAPRIQAVAPAPPPPPVLPAPPPAAPKIQAPAPEPPAAPSQAPPPPAPTPAGEAPSATPSPEESETQWRSKRKHVRFRPEGVVARMDKGGLLGKVGIGSVQTRVINLSEGGVLLVGKARYARGSRVSLRIEIPSHKDTIVCDAEVRWSYKNARDESEYYTGLSFVNLKAIEEKKIAKMREWFTSAEYKARSSTRRLRPDAKNLEITSKQDFEIIE